MYFVFGKHLFDLKQMNFFIMTLFTIYLSNIPYFDIYIFDKLSIMCYKEYRDIVSCIEMFEECIEMFLSDKIYPYSWFVEDKNFRSREQRFCNEYSLLLSSRKLTKELFFVFEHSYVLESRVDRFIGTLYYFFILFWNFWSEIHDFLDTHRDKSIKSTRSLRNVLDTIGTFFARSSIFLKPSDVSWVWSEESKEQFYERCFSFSIFSKERDKISFLELKRARRKEIFFSWVVKSKFCTL